MIEPVFDPKDYALFNKLGLGLTFNNGVAIMCVKTLKLILDAAREQKPDGTFYEDKRHQI